MSPEQEVLYEQLKLSVFVNFPSYYQETDRDSTTKRWEGCQGSRKMSENEFFRIAGYNDKANEAQRYKTFHDFLSITGTCSLGVGLGLLILFEISLLHTSYVVQMRLSAHQPPRGSTRAPSMARTITPY